MRAVLFMLLFASVLILFTGCGGGSKKDVGATQLLTLINDYRKGQSLPPLIYDTDLEQMVSQPYAIQLDNETPEHQYPYNEVGPDGRDLNDRLTDAGISVTASVEVGRSDPTLTNAQLFFNSLTTAELATISRTDVDRIGIGHVSPPPNIPPYNHYWVVDLIKRDTGP